MTGRAFALAAVLAVTFVGAADALEIRLSTSRSEVAVGEQFTVAVEVQASGVGNPPVPTIPDVVNLRRVSQYESRNFSYVNGRMTASLVLQLLLIADAPGTYTIGPAVAQKGDERVTSTTIQVTATPIGSSAPAPRAASPGSGASPSPSQAQGSPAPATQAGGRDIFVVGEVDDKTPFVNQQITYTFTFLRRSSVQIFEGSQYTPPATTGFWTEELDTTQPTEVTLDGVRYVAERVRFALFPTGPGTFSIGEAHLRTTVAERAQRRRDQFELFGGDPFGFFRQGREVRLATDPITVRVRALPDSGKPEDFSGAVGRFTLAASVDKSKLAAGDPVTLKLVLAGEGNVKVVPAPDLSRLDGFKVYESQSKEESRAAGGKIRGEKTWEYVLVPTTGGLGEIPSIHVSVFDPAARAYSMLATAPIPIEVEGTPLEDAIARGDGPDVAKERVRLRERDIRYVKPAPRAFREAAGPPVTRASFLASHAAAAFVFAAALFTRRRRDRLATDVRWARSTKARGAAEKTLANAEKSLRAGNLEAFHGDVSKALRGFVADKLGLAAASLDEPTIRAELDRRGATPEQIGFLMTMLQACDTARFAPGGSDRAKAADLVAGARRWIAQASRFAILLLALGASAISLVAPTRAEAMSTAARSVFERGLALYEKGDFEGARDSFREVAQGLEDPVVHYNLGNAEFKTGNLGEAIYQYRRAHALAPRDEDIAANLEYARFLALDSTEDAARTDRRAETWLGRVTPEEVLRLAPPLALLAALLAGVGLLARRPGVAVFARRAAFVSLALWGVALLGAGFLEMWTARDPEAVVLAKKSEVRAGPGPTFATAFILHEGAEVVVEGKRGDWIEISLPGDLRGWIAAREVAEL